MFGLDIRNEFYIFLVAINQGLIIGFIYDLYRVFRNKVKPKAIRTLIEDLLLWIIIIGIFFIFVFKNTGGIIRGYIFLGFTIGGFIYIRFLSKYNYPILNRIFQLIFSLINEIIKMITYPLRLTKKYFKYKLKKWVSINRELRSEAKKYFKLIKKKK